MCLPSHVDLLLRAPEYMYSCSLTDVSFQMNDNSIVICKLVITFCIENNNITGIIDQISIWCCFVKVSWLACWVENIQGSYKYVMLNPTSRLKVRFAARYCYYFVRFLHQITFPFYTCTRECDKKCEINCLL